MKTNLKAKVMLALLAGGMLCANGAWAATSKNWYGTTGNQWTTSFSSAVTRDLTLTVEDGQSVGNVALADVDYIYGGYSSGGVEVTGNSITFNTTNATTIQAQIRGGQSSGNVTNNSVTIEAGNFTKGIYGGYSYDFSSSGNAINNSVTINNGTFSGNAAIYGGYSKSDGSSGNAINNSVTINNGTFRLGISGGWSKNGTAGGSTPESGNKVIINEGIFKSNIYGGYSDSGNAINNSVTINNGIFNGNIGGGYSNSGGNATNNIVTINGGTFNNGSLYGGYVNTEEKISSGNTLNLNTVIGGKAYEVKYFQNVNFTIPKGMDTELPMLKLNSAMGVGGVTFTTDLNGMSLASGDYITLVKGVNGDSGSLDGHPGYYILTIGTGAAQYNELVYAPNAGGTPVAKADFEITTNGVKSAVGDKYYSDGESETDTIDNTNKEYGSKVKGNVDLTDGIATTNYSNNEIIIRRGIYNESVFGAFSDGSENMTNNKVIVYDGTFNGFIYGGYTVSGNATGNSVTINGGIFNNTDSGNLICGGCSFGSGATENFVTINGGIFSEYVFGGYSSSGNVTGNFVTINGGTFSNIICGGYGLSSAVRGSSVIIKNGIFNGFIVGGRSVQNGDAMNNTVTIEGGTFNDGFKLYGGWVSNGISSGNILNLKTKIGGKAADVKFFQEMNFTLPVGIQSGDKMLSTQNLYVNEGGGGEAKVNVYAANGVTLKKGDIITLVDVDAGDVLGGTFYAGEILGGAADFYFEDVEKKNGDSDTNDLVIVLNKDFEQKSGGGADQQKAPLEGVAAAAAMVNVTADLASGEGMTSMLAQTAGGATDTFGAMSAGRSKFKTGSHVDVDGWGVVVGAGKTKEWTNGSATTMGIFLEYGKGDFDTYNGVFHGDGDTKNHGVGVMARHKATNNNYYEGNIRYGRQETSWGQSEIGGYETDSRYYGVMVGMGHIIQLGDNELDVYGRYTYGHVGACNAKVGDNDYRFDSVKSHRVRVGGKYNFVRANSKAKPFVGVAWEHEFKGESRATIAGVGQAPAPSLKGNTGIIQAGCDWDLGEKWSVGVNANAYVGKRKGWDGMLRAVYNF